MSQYKPPTGEELKKLTTNQLNKFCLLFIRQFRNKDIMAMAKMLKDETIEKQNLNAARLIVNMLAEINSIMKENSYNSRNEKDINKDLFEKFNIDEREVEPKKSKVVKMVIKDDYEEGPNEKEEEG
jgi:uncharacterized protein YcbK (DUF882 family)